MARKDSIDARAEEILRLLDETPETPATRAAAALNLARDAGDGGLRQQYLQEAQSHIAQIDPRRDGSTVQRLQAQVLALQGHRGDTRVAHVTPGEIVVPLSVLTPDLRRELAQAVRNAGIDPRSLVVGDDRNAINPRTGQMEFANSTRQNPAFSDQSVPWWALDSRVVPQEMPGQQLRPMTRQQYEAQTHPVTSTESFGIGMRDPINASVQDTLHALPSSVVGAANRTFGSEFAPTADQYDRRLHDAERQYQARRAAAGQSGTDVWRGLGSIVGGIPAKAIDLPMQAGGRVSAGADALTGFAKGVLTDPVTDGGDNFGMTKLGQGLGGATEEVIQNGLRRKLLGR